MASRRMFNKELVSSDKFLDMPVSSQLLFFHLGMNADDEGFVSSPKRILRCIGCSEDDLKILSAKSFVIGFESGVIVIKEWNSHNTIRKDRFTATIHAEEKTLLQVIDFKQGQPSVNQNATIGLPSVDKVSLDNKNIAPFGESVEAKELPKKQTKIKHEYTESFEKFWTMYGRVGNKKSAFVKFRKLTKQQLSDLGENFMLYVNNTNTDGTYPSRKDAETYLNPVKEHWNNRVVITQRDNQQDQGMGY